MTVYLLRFVCSAVVLHFSVKQQEQNVWFTIEIKTTYTLRRESSNLLLQVNFRQSI